jgi:hypothetical protein
LRAALRPDSATEACRRVLHDLIGSQIPDDDVALVAIRRAASAVKGGES